MDGFTAGASAVRVIYKEPTIRSAEKIIERIILFFIKEWRRQFGASSLIEPSRRYYRM
jgi:hypothetical protein